MTNISAESVPMTIGSLIDAYFSDPDSPFPKLRPATRVHYRALAKRLRLDLGQYQIAAVKARQIKHWHEEFLRADIISMGHSVVGMLRIVAGFGGTILDDKDCAALSAVLSDMRFQMAKPRIEILTAEQVIAVRGQAHRLNRRSIAIMQAFQFDLMLRQKDLLGEYIPLSELIESYVTDGDKKWAYGALWEEIDENLIFTHVTSKRQKKIVRDLNQCPMILQEFMLAFGCIARNKMPERGPIISSNGELTVPERIQRKRTKGWKMPPNTVSVTRPGKWGNPFVPGNPYMTVGGAEAECVSAADAVRLYTPLANCRREEIERELRGKNLACFCPLDQPCHADVLLEIANQ